jgi:endonuclease YncB( thermonuclease family)
MGSENLAGGRGAAMIDRLTRRGRAILIAAAAIAALALAAFVLDRRPGEIAGAARVIDGDSIVVAGVEIRIFGIDAPEFRQTCRKSGRTWPCGRAATAVMRGMVAGREIRCRPREQDRYGRTVAVCYAGGLDLGGAMVKGGNAVSYGAYQADESEARDARRGVWSGSFDPPAAWRAHHPRRGHWTKRAT